MVLLTRLRRRREERGLSLRALEQLAGISKNQLSQLERGECKPRPSTILRLANALGCAPADLMEPESPLDSDTFP